MIYREWSAVWWSVCAFCATKTELVKTKCDIVWSIPHFVCWGRFLLYVGHDVVVGFGGVAVAAEEVGQQVVDADAFTDVVPEVAEDAAGVFLFLRFPFAHLALEVFFGEEAEHVVGHAEGDGFFLVLAGLEASYGEESVVVHAQLVADGVACDAVDHAVDDAQAVGHAHGVAHLFHGFGHTLADYVGVFLLVGTGGEEHDAAEDEHEQHDAGYHEAPGAPLGGGQRLLRHGDVAVGGACRCWRRGYGGGLFHFFIHGFGGCAALGTGLCPCRHRVAAGPAEDDGCAAVGARLGGGGHGAAAFNAFYQ